VPAEVIPAQSLNLDAQQALAVPVGDAPYDRAGSLETDRHVERSAFADNRFSRAWKPEEPVAGWTLM